MSWYVYILQCQDGSYYTGVTNNLNRRLREHRAGGAHYTGYNPFLALVYRESFPAKTAAEEREAQLKRWSRAKKRALVQGEQAVLRRLSRSRD